MPGQDAKKPIILAVDDDPGVLGAVSRDLRREYGSRYRILRADSGEAALQLLEKAKLANDPVALFLVDQRMPGMTGLEFLGRARQFYPGAKRVLLTAYADSAASIQAINETQLDYYLMKPWDPPEERLYPVITDLLDDWHAEFQPASAALTVIGHPYSAASHALKEFLGRNVVPYRWLDVEVAPEATELLGLAGAAPGDLPVVLLPDGTPLLQPSAADIAGHIGLRTAPELQLYDLVIVGAGPAGLAAGVYGASEGLSTLLVESQAPGGQAGQSSRIENYLGFPSGLSGADLSRRAATQARRFGAEILTPSEAVGLRREAGYTVVQLADGREAGGRTVLVATGVSYRRLDVPGAERLAGSGLYYGAALSEALEVKDGQAVVVGAGNSAGQAAMYLARFAAQVTLLVRGGSLGASMSQYLVAQIEQTPNIRVALHTSVAEVHGERRVEALTVVRRAPSGAARGGGASGASAAAGHSRAAGPAAAGPVAAGPAADGSPGSTEDPTRETLAADALFVFIGAEPHSEWLAGCLDLDEHGYIFTGTALAAQGEAGSGRRRAYWLETSLPGVFAAGDVRSRSVKRIASAVGEGAMAVQLIHQYLAEG